MAFGSDHHGAVVESRRPHVLRCRDARLHRRIASRHWTGSRRLRRGRSRVPEPLGQPAPRLVRSGAARRRCRPPPSRVHADRLAMLPRARFLHALGYAVLMPDFRAHGESSGTHTTFGALEAKDAHAAACLLHTLAPHEHIAAIGVSLGGAAAILGQKPLPVDALVQSSSRSTRRSTRRRRTASTPGWARSVPGLRRASFARSSRPSA